MSREATDQLYIELGYFTPEEYYVYTAEAVAAVNSNFELACSAESGTLQEGAADLSAVITLSADASVTREFDSAFASEFAQTTDAGKIVDAQITTDSLFTPVFDINAQLAGDALLEVISSLENTISKYTGFESTLENIVNLSLQGVMTADGVSALSTSFEEVVDAARLRGVDASLAASSSLSIDAVITADGIALEAGEFTLAADAEIAILADAALTSEFSVAAIGEEFILRTYPYSRPNPFQGYWYNRTGNATTQNDGVAFYQTTYKHEGTHGVGIDLELVTTATVNKFAYLKADTPSLQIGANEDFIFSAYIYDNYPQAVYSNPLLVSVGASAPSWYFSGTNTVEAASYDSDSSFISIGIYEPNGNHYVQAKLKKSDGTFINLLLNSTSNLFTAGLITVRRKNGVVELIKNSTVIASTSYSGAFASFDRIQLFPYDRPNDSNYYDKVMFKKGYGGSSTFNQSVDLLDDEYTVINALFNQTLDDSLEGWILEGAAALNATASIVAVPNFTVDGITIHQSSGTLVADVGVIYEASASLSSEFAQTAEGEFVPQESSADLSAEFTQTAEAYRIQEGSAALSAEFAQATDGYRTLEFAVQTDAIFSELAAVARVGAGFITAESYVNLTADVSKTTGFTADLLGVNTLNATVYKTVEGNAEISSESTVSVDAVKTTDVDSAQNSEFTSSTVGDRIRFADSSIASEFTVAANVSGGFIGGDAQLEVTATVDASGDRIRFGDSELSSTASISAIADRFAEMPASLASEFATTVDYTRTRDAQISTDSLFSPAFDVNAQLAGVALLEASASLAAVANVIQGQAAELISAFNATVDAISYKAFDAALSSEAQLSADGFVGLTGDADLNSEFTVSCDGDVTGVGSSALISVASLITAVPEVLRSAESALTSSAIISATVVVIQETGAAVNSTASLAAELSRIVDSGAVNLGALFTPTVTYRVLVLDQYVYTIPRETRSYTIRRESRSHSIERENRNYTIRG